MFGFNIFLSFVWLACWGVMTPSQFLIGFIIGFVIIWFSEKFGLIKNSNYTTRFLVGINLFFFFLFELWKSNIRVAKDMLRIKPQIMPAIVAVPVSLKTDWAITLMANLISLTPGTLSLDITRDKSTIFIHTMYLDGNDKVGFVECLKKGFEKRLLILESAS